MTEGGGGGAPLSLPLGLPCTPMRLQTVKGKRYIVVWVCWRLSEIMRAAIPGIACDFISLNRSW